MPTEHVETIRLTRDRIVVSYSGPPIPHGMEERLRAYWVARLDRLTRTILGDLAALSENCYKLRTPPDAPQEPFSGPLARVMLSGS